jgi:hypothetical protein
MMLKHNNKLSWTTHRVSTGRHGIRVHDNVWSKEARGTHTPGQRLNTNLLVASIINACRWCGGGADGVVRGAESLGVFRGLPDPIYSCH